MRRDWLLAAGFAVAVAVGGWRAGLGQEEARPLDAAGFGLMCVAALGLAWRRSAPLVPVVVAVGVTSAYLLLRYPFGPILLTVVWAMFEYARRRPLRASALALGVGAGVSVLAVLPRLSQDLDLLAVGLLLWSACWLVVPWSLGAVAYMRGQTLRRERAELVRRAVLEERIRVSREVHDVAGHGFAVVAMQAGVALVVLDEQPEQVRESLQAIRDTSRAALDELRAVIENIDSPADVDALVEQVRAGGVAVALEYDGLAGASERQRRIAYEVVRESLTNVVKHSPRAGAAVSVRLVGEDVAVSISNDGAAHKRANNGTAHGREVDGTAHGREVDGAAHGRDSVGAAYGREVDGAAHGRDSVGAAHGSENDSAAHGSGQDSGGRGIDGMRERVEGVGGSFEVRAGQSFAVHARIPK